MIRISKSKEHKRLQCDCGYVSKRTGYIDMVTHVTFTHCNSVELARIRPDLQDVWYGDIKAVVYTRTESGWKATRIG